MSEPLLSVKNLKVSYGGIHAVKGIDFTVNSGEQVTLIGANGAGKTSSLRALTGLQPFEGEILFDGLSIRGVPPHRLLQQGLVMVPEGRGIFARMTVLENLQLGAYSRSDKPAVRQDLEQVCALFPRLRERLRQQAGLLSGGEQQMVAIGRALLSRPRLLILDEPSMGLAPIVVEAIFEVIKRLSSDGVTLLLVEQNARLALASTDRAYVLDSGNLNHSGRSADLLDDEKIKQAYLGE
ncbi:MULTISPECIES: ABC transporter ATP-binding protein [Serratia]|jgi:branched-chain amino acid transport system ATP-binding protein|uniref:High-affinity branched-chain amino acid transport ATP-binding protein n=1 Tax=Serratia liquefaciens TaxID=614 RepID=A0A515CUX8_SERLI|nr:MULTISPECIES: ABC transporter ATP-binding protein [Serratia]MBV0842091.1 ABC transporter ATP-binding protein [Serratia liquefaciens]MCS4319042.1 branched-chain amino acid transport system ATP-binding protein [Serratia sp. BIGb0234]NWA19115.1 ABC transporter ATP-binding protein [Serratia liquefaciens]QDL31972.1 ABC transporter ATP-binding protein [Serratia liquefaciens]QQU57488.1 ABC transporter ATP-binding protein [Serratia liquefaciens]